MSNCKLQHTILVLGMNHGPERKLFDRNERSGLEKYVNLTKDYSEDFVTLSAAHIEDAKYGMVTSIYSII